MWCVAIEVVEIAFQIQAEADLLGDEVAGEGGLPALIQDGLLDPFDTAFVCGLPARMNV